MHSNISMLALMFATILSTSTNALPTFKKGFSLAPSVFGINVRRKFLNSSSPRSANTCADPSLAQTFFQAFQAPTTVHVFKPHWSFVDVNTATASNLWTDQHPAFRGWASQQPFTVPFFQLGNAGRTEYVYLLGPDAQTPPIISGFNTDVKVVAWVYDSPVCGSVPLMSAVYAQGTDHYYTTDVNEHASISATAGWADSGVVAYVLPLSLS